jgi:DNA-binding NarL/FixJ family response regulator
MVAPAVRLLIADGSDAVRRAIFTLLKLESGVTVTGQVRDYPELLKALSESPPDVILMDVHTPSEDRFDPASIKAQLRGSRLLAMSVWNDPETASLAEKYGALKLLDKSSLASTLVPAIEECVHHA